MALGNKRQDPCMKLKEVNIQVCTDCNFHCAHCSQNASSSGRPLSPEEVSFVVSELEKCECERFSFMGGEATLHLELLNEVISAVKRGKNAGSEVCVVTNGWFASQQQTLERTLKALPLISEVQVSVDKFHLPFLRQEAIVDLVRACREFGIKVLGKASFANPLDLIWLRQLENDTGLHMIYGCISRIGRGSSLSIPCLDTEFSESMPAPDRLDCESWNKIRYIIDQGFSCCCGELAYDSETARVVFSKDGIQGFHSSEFFSFLRGPDFYSADFFRGLCAKRASRGSSLACDYCMHRTKSVFLRD